MTSNIGALQNHQQFVQNKPRNKVKRVHKLTQWSRVYEFRSHYFQKTTDKPDNEFNKMKGATAS